MVVDEKGRSPEEEYLSCEDATELWAIVGSETRFNRRVVDVPDTGEDYNQRLLYLLAVAVFRRVEHLAKQRPWRKLLRVAEAYAEGKATSDQLGDAHEQVQRISLHKLSATRAAAVCTLWLLPDDYKVIRGVDHVSDVAGYLAAIEAGVLEQKAKIDVAQSVWKAPAFLAGKTKEERAICALVRDIFGNPFRPQPVIDPGWLAWKDGTIPKMARAIYEEQRFDGMPILADALEEAGCHHEDILSHCRGLGPHVRGCWVLDLILGKS
jgi:hypothetical protein